MEGLTPLQQRTLAVLRRPTEPVVFDSGFVAELVDGFTSALDELAQRVEDSPLWVSKHALSSVLGCEVQHLAPDAFRWTTANAVGQVAHKAIQLMVHWRGEPVPADVVDDALARLADDSSGIGDFVAGLSSGDEAELRSLAVEKVTKFAECFPPLDKRAQPVTEARVQWPLDGPIVLSGKVDLVIGKPAGTESRKVIVDLKTGRVSPRHREDLRFYALVETLRSGVPPRKLASFYLDVGEAQVEDVTESVLRTAARRTLDAVHTMLELTADARPPVLRPGPSCRWCQLLLTCDAGRAHVHAADGGHDD
jgi:CRISPR/Cas system-associated exonuclease Cas4 (RecB family)